MFSAHAEAKRRFSKAQDLSLDELQRKQAWLERCIKAGRLV